MKSTRKTARCFESSGSTIATIPISRAEPHKKRAAALAAVLAAGAIGLTAPPKALAQHNTDMWIGQSAGQLAWQPLGLIPGSVYHPLQRVDTFIHGWSNNDPGFDHVNASSGGVAPLPASAEVYLEVIQLDPAIYVIDNSFQVLALPGDQTFLGEDDLHEHITWLVDEDDPSFDPEQCVWEATFKLVDEGGGLSDSQPFTLLFANVPVRGGGFPPGSAHASGDFNLDERVDKDDHKAFETCSVGPGLRPMPTAPEITTCEVDCHNALDFDNDMDLDLRDFAGLQVVFGD